MPPRRGSVAKRGGPAASDPDNLSADAASELLRDLEHALPLRKLLWLAKADCPPCDGSCKTKSKHNPSCFCGLIPAPGSFRTKGLWQKDLGSQASSNDPNDLRREDSSPRGLLNLGNTCYMNSALQCMFMMPSFRQAMLLLEPGLAHQPIVRELREVFLALAASPKRVVDPSAFAEALMLDNTIQQDGTEFFMLLLDKLKEVFLARSSDKAVAQLIPRLFKGLLSHRTVCKAASMQAEFLTDDNQYACDFCARKTDASRQMVLRSLPPYLCLSLQRFVYDQRKGDKVKVADRFGFPLLLDLPCLLASVAEDDGHSSIVQGPQGRAVGPYQLMAVLLHKGPSTSRGHYVAHIRDEQGNWWRFDDGEVTPLGAAPLGSQDHGGGPGAAAGAKASHKAPASTSRLPRKRGEGRTAGGSRAPARNARKRRAMEAVTDSDEEGAGGARLEGEDGPAQALVISSCNAYMLLYRAVGWEEPQAALDMQRAPEGVVREVAAMQQAYEEECAQHAAQQQGAESSRATRREVVRSVLATASLPPDQLAHGFWLPASWLEQWANSEAPPPALDLSPLTCLHGNLDPAKLQQAKCVSQEAWLQLQGAEAGAGVGAGAGGAGAGVGPAGALPSSRLCRDCIRLRLQRLVNAANADAVRKEVEVLLESRSRQGGEGEGLDSDASDQEGADGFYVARSWLTGAGC
ncbi:hypothetical protein QJQ45_005666 [Haematococcus lacustris]|nr:hypothetical protein QJQ45_005666 [Haematococcus lacustris]